MIADLLEPYLNDPAQRFCLGAALRRYLPKAFQRPDKNESLRRQDANFRKRAFGFALIALAAKLANSDGPFREVEFQAFCDLFPLPESQTALHRLFAMAGKQEAGAEGDIRRIMQLFPGKQALFEAVMMRLTKLAAADGPINDREKQWLAQARAGFARAETAAAEKPVAKPAKAGEDPYRVLGVKRSQSDADIKKAYRMRVRQLHPDGLAVQGSGAQAVAAAGVELAQVTAAYRVIAAQRKMK